MSLKKITTIGLLIFVAASLVMLISKGILFNRTGKTLQNSIQAQQENQEVSFQTIGSSDYIIKPDANVDVVYYFMTTQRCQNCMKIETYTQEAVQENCEEMLNNKKMLWKMVNVDEPQNRHFIQDYQLITKSVVLVKYRDSKQVEWKNLDQVWNLLGDKTAFQDYIINEIESFVKES